MSNGGGNPVKLGTGICRRETERAIQVLLNDGDTLWVPKSALHDDCECYKTGTDGELIVMQWWADSAGLPRAPVTLGPPHA